MARKSCRGRSPSTALVDKLADLSPGGVRHSGLKSLALECGVPETKVAGALVFCQDLAKAPLNQCLDCRVLRSLRVFAFSVLSMALATGTAPPESTQDPTPASR